MSRRNRRRRQRRQQEQARKDKIISGNQVEQPGQLGRRSGERGALEKECQYCYDEAVGERGGMKLCQFHLGRLGGGSDMDGVIQSRGGSGVVHGSRVSGGSSTTSHGTWKGADKQPVSGRSRPSGTLRISPKVWAKLKFFRDRGSSEISGFGISYRSDPLYVVDFLTIKQQASAASVEFDDDALNKYLDDMVKVGWHPSEVMRIWLHTHPGNSASPSGVDVNTFRDVFSGSDWSIMAILAKGGEFKAKFRYNITTEGVVSAVFGSGKEADLEVRPDLSPPFDGISQEQYEAWEDEYIANIMTRSYNTASNWQSGRNSSDGNWNRGDNSDTQGFSSGGGVKQDITLKEALQISTRSILEQDEIPAWGGAHRLKSGETDIAFMPVSNSVEQILSIEEYKEGAVVITDFGWYEYDGETSIMADEGDEIDSLRDIAALVPPEASGEVTWRWVDAQYAPMKITRLVNGEFIDLRDDDKAAESELYVYEKGSSTGATASSAAAAGFAAAGTSDEEKKDDKTDEEKKTLSDQDTDVVKVADVVKEVEKTNVGGNNTGTGTCVVVRGGDSRAAGFASSGGAAEGRPVGP